MEDLIGKIEKMNQKIPLISIITAVYNGVTTLEQTILSVINQTYKNIEYIIIDGSSTDGTVDIIKKYEKYLAYWISEPDEGTYYAMNKGIKKATGEWINFMNSGDWFYSEFILNDIFANKENACSDIIYGSIYCNFKNKITHIKPRKLENIRKGIPFCHQAVFVKRNVIPYFDTQFKISADYEMFYKLYNKGYVFKEVYLDIAFFCSNGLSSNNLKLLFTENFIINKRYNNNILYPRYIYLKDIICCFLVSIRKTLLKKKIYNEKNTACIRDAS
jgi:glycosyltransferase involved in cell wall biosynthesis